MGRMWQRALLNSVGGIVIALAAGGPAAAQQSQSSVGLEEIIVTARRVEENLQQVPITVLAFSESTLQDQHITRGLDLDKIIPGIYVAATSTSAKNGRFVNIFSRGVRGVVPY